MIGKHSAARASRLTGPPAFLAACVLLTFLASAPAVAGTPAVVASSDGTPISYEVHGQGDPTLLLIHGWSCDSRYFREQIEPFSRRYRVVTVDLAGHGHSGAGREDFTLASFGQDVRAVADAVGGDRLILVGHSMGGLVIAEAARLLPGRVLGLIAVDSLQDLGFEVTEEFAAGMLAPLEADFAVGCRAFAAGMMGPDADDDLKSWIAADMASAPPAVAVSAMRSYMQMWISGAAPRLFEELPLPVVGVCADLWPVDAEANRQHMQSYEAIVLEGTGHFLMLSSPDEFNEALERAIGQIVR